MPIDPITYLQFTASQAARFALGNGADAETVATVLEDLASAIRDPGSVAENMSPILPDEF